MKGLIYLLKTQKEPLYKIGFTTVSVAQRMAELQTGCPYKLGYIFHIRSKDPKITEAYLHQQFAANRLQGEWFKLDAVDVSKCLVIMQSLEAQMCLERIHQSDIGDDKREDWECDHSPEIKPSKSRKNHVFNEETDATWYRWLPSKDEIIAGLEETTGNLTFYTRNTLKKTEAEYNRKTRQAIANLLVERNRIDLIEKLGIDPADYNL